MRDMVQIRRGSRKDYEGPEAKIGRSQFNRSHGLKMTFDASYIYPILVDDVLPGDTFTCSLNGFARIFSPLDAPVMDNIELETFFFFVPNRLVWENWVDFQGEHDGVGAQDTSFTIPIVNDVVVDHDVGIVTGHGLAAYLGLPDGYSSATGTGVSALPFRCYERIFNEWFRDQNIEAVQAMDIDDGPDAIGGYEIRKGNKKHDYFTSALPYLQKGTAVTINPAGADVWHDAADDAELTTWSTVNDQYQKMAADGTFVDASTGTLGLTAAKLYTDLSGFTVNALRQSISIQRLLERDARGGTRYVEMIKAHFGVTSPDFRLQRPEYLGGGKSFINISPVANTSATAGQDQGELAGVGTGIISGHGWAKSFTEHGHIIGLIRARGDLTYFQGIDRMWNRSTRYDFYIPALANLGEQGILNKEIFGKANNATVDIQIFGYQERWQEYRTKLSRVVGMFNPDAASALSFWHLAEDFSSQPTLGTTFMRDNTPMDRITTVDTGPHFLLDLWFDYKCARPIPVRSIPSLTTTF